MEPLCRNWDGSIDPIVGGATIFIVPNSSDVDMGDPEKDNGPSTMVLNNILSPLTLISYLLNNNLYHLASRVEGAKLLYLQMDQWTPRRKIRFFSLMGNAQYLTKDPDVRMLQDFAKERGWWDGVDYKKNLIFSVVNTMGRYCVQISMNGHTTKFTSDSQTAATNYAASAMLSSQKKKKSVRCVDEELDSFPIVELVPMINPEVVMLPIDYHNVIVDQGEKIYFCDAIESVGSFSSESAQRESVDQDKVSLASLFIEKKQDKILTSEIRESEYYTTDKQWNDYVTQRSPNRLSEVVRILSQLPYGRVVAPCDGPGVAGLACELLDVEYLSSDKNCLRNRIKWVDVIPETWEATQKRVQKGDIVFLSHCAEMCPTIVLSYLSLDTDNCVVYYGKEPMFEGMTKMFQLSNYLWANRKLEIVIPPVQLADDLYFNQILKHHTLGLVSNIALRNVRMLSLFSADTKFCYYGSGAKVREFSEFLKTYFYSEEKVHPNILDKIRDKDVVPVAIIAYTADELITSFSFSVNSVVLDMRVGKFYKQFPKFFPLMFKHYNKCYRRTIYEFFGKLETIVGRGVNYDRSLGFITYVWFEKQGTVILRAENVNVYHRLIVGVT